MLTVDVANWIGVLSSSSSRPPLTSSLPDSQIPCQIRMAHESVQDGSISCPRPPFIDEFFSGPLNPGGPCGRYEAGRTTMTGVSRLALPVGGNEEPGHHP